MSGHAFLERRFLVIPSIRSSRIYVIDTKPHPTEARIYKVISDRKVSILIEDWEAHALANPTNIAFGGKNFDQLFAANLGRWHITQIDLRVRGAPLASHRDHPPTRRR